jgi:hypothetical protein
MYASDWRMLIQENIISISSKKGALFISGWP